MEIDDAITKVEIDDDGEGPSSKESTVEVEAQDIEVERLIFIGIDSREPKNGNKVNV